MTILLILAGTCKKIAPQEAEYEKVCESRREWSRLPALSDWEHGTKQRERVEVELAIYPEILGRAARSVHEQQDAHPMKWEVIRFLPKKID